LVFSPDGKTLAAGCNDGTTELWETQTKRRRATLEGHSNAVLAVAFSPDGKLLASGSADGTVLLWDAPTGRPKTAFQGHQGEVYSVAFSGDGRLLASAGEDKVVRLLEVATGRRRAPLQGQYAVYAVAFNRDGRLLASVKTTSHLAWSTEGPYVLEGTVEAPGAPEVRLWDTNTGLAKSLIKGRAAGAFLSFAFRADGKVLATGNGNDTVSLWDMATGRVKTTLRWHKGGVKSVAFSSDGVLLATGDNEDEAALWSVARRQLAPPREELPTSNRNSLERFRFPQWEVRATLKGHTGAFTPDGKLLAFGSNDGNIRLWEVQALLKAGK
jgi:WD40 repeat protein